MEGFVQVVSTVGFPIACCAFMGYYMIKLQEIIASIEKQIAISNERLTAIEDKLNRNDTNEGVK